MQQEKKQTLPQESDHLRFYITPPRRSALQKERATDLYMHTIEEYLGCNGGDLRSYEEIFTTFLSSPTYNELDPDEQASFLFRIDVLRQLLTDIRFIAHAQL